MIVQPGPVVDFLIANQNARDPFSLDWAKVINVNAAYCYYTGCQGAFSCVFLNILFIIPTGQEDAKKLEGED